MHACVYIHASVFSSVREKGKRWNKEQREKEQEQKQVKKRGGERRGRGEGGEKGRRVRTGKRRGQGGLVRRGESERLLVFSASRPSDPLVINGNPFRKANRPTDRQSKFQYQHNSLQRHRRQDIAIVPRSTK